MTKPETLADLRPDPLNPRRISTRQREALMRSHLDFGDLSGIVVNVRTRQLVGGHQRTDVFRDRRSVVVKRAYRDSTGTVAIGHVEVPQAAGGTIRIPYREVDWDRRRQAAANIAANAGGGEFDDVKLGKILARLKDERFPIETIPIDPVEIRRTTRMFESEQKRAQGMDGDGGEFASVSIEDLKAEAPHQCPRCGHQWTGTTKPSFGELHRLKDDNPMKVQARKLARKILDRRAQEREETRASRRRGR